MYPEDRYIGYTLDNVQEEVREEEGYGRMTVEEYLRYEYDWECRDGEIILIKDSRRFTFQKTAHVSDICNVVVDISK